MQKHFIVYIIAIIIVLVTVFLSQQAYSGKIGKNIISNAANQASAYLAKAKGTSLIIPDIGSKISSQLQSGGEVIQNALDQGKQKISDAEKNIQNYFSGVANSILHPGENNNCPTQSSQTSSGQ